MSTLHSSLLFVHVALGAAAVVLFWGPLVTARGGYWHQRTGRWYVSCMVGVSLSGAVMSALALAWPQQWLGGAPDVAQLAQARDTYLFLGYLSLLTFTTVSHGVVVLRAREQRQQLRRWRVLCWPTLLVLAGVAQLVRFLAAGGLLPGIFGALGIFLGLPMLLYCLRASVPLGEWRLEHLGAMLGSGIAAYTAFLVFGAQALFEVRGGLAMSVWFAPGLVGGLAIALLRRRHRRRRGATQI
ncbi:hypothetical protein [Parahaliea aestuarii]|uniref:DUF2306 domain-containing protein n=1 Tax=Parahaliea aestuarii TaxID=1852021 RepID=A0A5C9A1Q6_9GAMM|nr:hypothetical protein [Parahaliea aestuarii]TXS94815.1 hypothetical protein FVW59_02595 [Parahaliea aestuarii]